MRACMHTGFISWRVKHPGLLCYRARLQDLIDDLDCNYDASCTFSHFMDLCRLYKAPEPEPEFDMSVITQAELAEYKDAFTFYSRDSGGKLNGCDLFAPRAPRGVGVSANFRGV